MQAGVMGAGDLHPFEKHKFFWRRCGHCKALKPAYEALASRVAGKVRVAAIDCTENTATCQARLMFLPEVVSHGHSGTMFSLMAPLAHVHSLLGPAEYGGNGNPMLKFFGENKQRPLESECACINCDVLLALQEFGVSGYPTLKFFGENKRRPLEYSGGRDADAMASFVLAKWAALQPPPEVRELVGQHVLEDECLGDGQRPAKKLWCPPPPFVRAIFCAISYALSYQLGRCLTSAKNCGEGFVRSSVLTLCFGPSHVRKLCKLDESHPLPQMARVWANPWL